MNISSIRTTSNPEGQSASMNRINSETPHKSHQFQKSRNLGTIFLAYLKYHGFLCKIGHPELWLFISFPIFGVPVLPKRPREAEESWDPSRAKHMGIYWNVDATRIKYVYIYIVYIGILHSRVHYCFLERWGFRNTQEFFAVFYRGARFMEVMQFL
jgi:hypothetical protein